MTPFIQNYPATAAIVMLACFAAYGAICLLAGLVIGARSRDRPPRDVPMEWQSDAYSGEK
jgi:hypothetical protein